MSDDRLRTAVYDAIEACKGQALDVGIAAGIAAGLEYIRAADGLKVREMALEKIDSVDIAQALVKVQREAGNVAPVIAKLGSDDYAAFERQVRGGHRKERGLYHILDTPVVIGIGVPESHVRFEWEERG
jgi:hypothetical protein